MQSSDICFSSTELVENTWLIKGTGASSYLLTGERCGIMIDSGMSLADIHQYVSTLTNVPVDIVLNTHGHFDHTGGNGYFHTAFMGDLASEIAKQPNGNSSPAENAYPMNYSILTIKDGFSIDLGGRIVEGIWIGGHSPDSFVYLDHKEHILFGGDSVQTHIPLKYKCIDPQPGLMRYAMSLSRLMARRDEIQYICGGHNDSLLDGSLLNHLLICALLGIDGQRDQQPPMPPGHDPSKGPFKLHDPANSGYTVYKDAAISYDKRYVDSYKEADFIAGT
ncbi:MAG: MBL fold metallo-hydrolase [Lachnospiraceae bacterium]|jgi:hydroxyacylglutathione hydrolase|nr:MBL fold metallo-hydrolase [Lachnospiraceae bacterium]